MNDKRDICEFCGKNLTYALTPKENKDLSCEFCGKIFNTNTFCENDHYICDDCHQSDAIKIIEEVTELTELKDPFILADKIMRHPKFKMYGPEHHVLAPVVILTTLKNNNIKKPNGELITLFDIKEAIRRASKIPGGWCGFYGSCGAGMGSGITISIFTNANPGKISERSLANQMTSICLTKISDNLEHCCKRSVKISICETLDFLEEYFDIKMNYHPKSCHFSNYNEKCEKENCLFYLVHPINAYLMKK